MGHGKESPRQKMIGLMYLFLTCMLALNVSKEVLDAFILINDKLQITNENFIGKNNIVYEALTKASQTNPVKAGPANSKAVLIQKKAAALVDTMQYYKELIICTADGLGEGKPANLERVDGKRVSEFEVHGELKIAPIENHVNSKDNSDVPAQIMYGQTNNGKGKELKKLVEEFRTFLIDTVIGADSTKAPSKVRNIMDALSTDDEKIEGAVHPWESLNFEHLPLMAVVTNLTQMQTAVRNVEGDIISYLLAGLDSDSFKFNKLAPIVTPKSNYVMKGQKYFAEIFLGASDTTKAPIVEIGTVQKDKDGNLFINKPLKLKVDAKTGKAVYEVPGNSVGKRKYEGLIKVLKPNTENEYSVFKFEQEYQVAQSSVVISPTKMNVFYVGVNNPVEISVPGIPSSQITPSMSAGSIRKSGKGYIVKCKKPGKTSVRVYATIDGKKKLMGSKKFRIKPVPDPVAMVWGMEGGVISASKLRAAKEVQAKMIGFDFDLKFKVTSFTASTKVGEYVVDESVKGSKIRSSVKSKIFAKLKKGQKVYFEEIKAIGPDKKPRKLGIIMFKVN
jgi:gliding motility-associated protein GldM